MTIPSRLSTRLNYRALIAFPFLGAFEGSLIAFADEIYIDDLFDLIPLFFGALFGSMLGFVFGLLILWPTRKESLWRIAVYTVPGTVLFGIVGFLAPDMRKWIPRLLSDLYPLLPMSLGFWIGFVLLYLRRMPPHGGNEYLPDM